MKMVKVRLSATIPEALSKPMPYDASVEQWREFKDALREWTGFSREELAFDDDNDAAIAWAQLAWRLAYNVLPIFREWREAKRKNKGGRPKLDKPDGLFGLANPHQELLWAVMKRVVDDVRADRKTSIVAACKHLAHDTKALPPRYHNLTHARLAKLYHEGARYDKAMRDKLGGRNSLAAPPAFIREYLKS